MTEGGMMEGGRKRKRGGERVGVGQNVLHTLGSV